MTDTLEVIGDRYTLPLVRELMYGFRRFSDLAVLLGAPRTVLTARLRRLEDAGVVERVQYCEHPPRFEYHLTGAGLALVPVLLAVKAWGEQHLEGCEETVVFGHRCGAPLRPVSVCAACGEPIRPGEFTVVGGTHPPTSPPR